MNYIAMNVFEPRIFFAWEADTEDDVDPADRSCGSLEPEDRWVRSGVYPGVVIWMDARDAR